MQDKRYIAQDFKTEVLCFFKDTNGGVYDLYIKGCCIAVGISQENLNKLVIILKLKNK